MVTVLLGLIFQQADPRAVIRDATHAVEVDSAAPARARWETRLRATPADRPSLLALGTLARLTYDYEQADKHYSTLTAGSPDLYTIYARLGRAEASRINNSLDSAAADFLQAAAEARALNHRSAEAESLIGLGLVTSRLASVDSALRILARAEPLVSGEPMLEARLRCVRVPILLTAGRPGAKRDADRGVSLARASGNTRLTGSCWLARGAWTYFNVDDPAASAPPFDSAEAYHRRARDFANAAESVAWSGYDHFSFFNHAAAVADLNEAIRLGRKSGNRFAEAWALRLRGTVEWRTGAFPAATRSIGQAESIARRLGDRAELLNVLRMTGNVAFGQARFREADTAYREVLGGAEELGDAIVRMQAMNGLAWVSGARGDWPAAERQHRETIAFMQRNNLEGLIPGMRYAGGVIALRNGRLDSAEAAFRWYLESSSPTEYAGRYQSRARLAEIALRHGRVDSAVLELTRASDHLDSLRATLTDDGLRTLAFQTSGGKLEEPDYGFARLIAAFVEAGRTREAFRLVEHRRARDLADRLLWSSPTRRWDAPQVTPRAPDDSTAVIEFTAGRWGQPSTAFVLLGDELTAYVLPSMDSVGPRIERFIGLVETGADARQAGDLVRRALLDPVLASLPERISRLLIVPDDVLHRLPFDALPLDGRPLLARYSVALAPSVTIAAQLASRPAHGGTPTLVVLGNPDQDSLPPLPFAEREAKAVGRFGGDAVVRLGAAATEHFLKSRPFQGGGVLHLASHAVVDDWTSDRTALLLAPGNGDDGSLTPAEILALDLGVDLVVLSACRTAAGPVIRGEGVQGLTAPLLAAGARAVVATHWPIRDGAALRLSRRFYRELSRGLPVGEALRQAKLDAMRNGGPSRDWAAFTIVGDAMLRIPLQAPPSRLRWALLAAMLAMISVGLWRERNRRRANLGPVGRADQHPPVVGGPHLE
jgi:tetratricopeptide (TPR) repeat protein